jgi:hypothetical protein
MRIERSPSLNWYFIACLMICVTFWVGVVKLVWKVAF